jgi:hypothetical protein
MHTPPQDPAPGGTQPPEPAPSEPPAAVTAPPKKVRCSYSPPIVLVQAISVLHATRGRIGRSVLLKRSRLRSCQRMGHLSAFQVHDDEL